MGNQLVNSMVRGFGFTLGRKAANVVTAPRQSQKSVETVSFSKKQQELIDQNEQIKAGVIKILEDTELYYKNGKITEAEYNILKSKSNEQLVEVNKEIEKLKSVSTSKGSVWPTLIGVIIGIYAVLWMLKAIKGL
jgi:hypothetical protein